MFVNCVIVMKNIGIKKMVSSVLLIILLNILVLIVCCVLLLVLLVSISGIIFNVKVREVIRIGCKCSFVVVNVVLIRFFFFFINCFVNLIIRIVFLVESLIRVIRFILKKMLFVIFVMDMVSIVLSSFRGIMSMIVKGMD